MDRGIGDNASWRLAGAGTRSVALPARPSTLPTRRHAAPGNENAIARVFFFKTLHLELDVEFYNILAVPPGVP